MSNPGPTPIIETLILVVWAGVPAIIAFFIGKRHEKNGELGNVDRLLVLAMTAWILVFVLPLWQ